jgi:hypothetical protein
MAAGVAFTSNDFLFTADSNDWLEVQSIQFDTLIVGNQENLPVPSNPQDPKTRYTLSPELLARQALFGAAGSSSIRRSGKARYRSAVAKHKIVKEGWSIVSKEELSVAPVPGIQGNKPTNYSEAAEALRKLKQESPAQAAGLKILRLSEVSNN